MSSFLTPVGPMSRGHRTWSSGSEQLLVSLEAAKQVNTKLIPCTWGDLSTSEGANTRGL